MDLSLKLIYFPFKSKLDGYKSYSYYIVNTTNIVLQLCVSHYLNFSHREQKCYICHSFSMSELSGAYMNLQKKINMDGRTKKLKGEIFGINIGKMIKIIFSGKMFH